MSLISKVCQLCPLRIIWRSREDVEERASLSFVVRKLQRLEKAEPRSKDVGFLIKRQSIIIIFFYTTNLLELSMTI